MNFPASSIAAACFVGMPDASAPAIMIAATACPAPGFLQHHIYCPRHQPHVHALLPQKPSDIWLHLHHIVKAGMFMPRKINIDMSGAPVGYVKKFPCSQCDIFLGCCESAVVSHDAAYIPKPQQHVGLFQQGHLCPCFSCRQRSSASGPATAYDHHFIQKNPSFALSCLGYAKEGSLVSVWCRRTQGARSVLYSTSRISLWLAFFP